jgi:hypothetical protein
VVVFWNHFNHNATVFKGLGRKIESCALRRHPIAGLVDPRQRFDRGGSPPDSVALTPESGATGAKRMAMRFAHISARVAGLQSIERRAVPRAGVAMSLVSVTARSMAADAPYRFEVVLWKLTAAPNG